MTTKTVLILTLLAGLFAGNTAFGDRPTSKKKILIHNGTNLTVSFKYSTYQSWVRGTVAGQNGQHFADYTALARSLNTIGTTAYVGGGLAGEGPENIYIWRSDWPMYKNEANAITLPLTGVGSGYYSFTPFKDRDVAAGKYETQRFVMRTYIYADRWQLDIAQDMAPTGIQPPSDEPEYSYGDDDDDNYDYGDDNGNDDGGSSDDEYLRIFSR